MNNYYKKIDWNYDKEALLELTTKVNHIGMINLPKEYRLQIKHILNIPIQPFSILYFNVEENGIGTIHIDYENDNICNWAINLPLTPNFVYMNWYVQTKKHTEFYIRDDNFAISPRLDIKYAEKIESCQISQPLIVKINYWHNVSNPSSQFSKFISIRFINIPYEKFLSFIKDI